MLDLEELCLECSSFLPKSHSSWDSSPAPRLPGWQPSQTARTGAASWPSLLSKEPPGREDVFFFSFFLSGLLEDKKGLEKF